MSEVAGLNKEGSKRLLAPFFKALVGALGGSHVRVHGVFSLPLLLLLLPKAPDPSWVWCSWFRASMAARDRPDQHFQKSGANKRHV